MISKEEITYCNIAQKRHCIKTGKPLSAIPFAEVKELIAIHGEKRARLVLAKLQHGISIEWVLTDSEGLQKLAYSQPIEYLIYALSALLVKPDNDSIIALTEDVADKIAANEFLQTIPYEQVKNCAELTRRLLALNRPIAIQEMIDNCSLKSILESADTLTKFQLTLQACIKQIGLGYYDDKLVSQRNRQKKELFAQQRRLTALTTLELEIAESLPDFDDVNMPLSELESILLATSTRKLKSKERAIAQVKRDLKLKAPLSSHSNSFAGKFGGLKFGGKKS